MYKGDGWPKDRHGFSDPLSPHEEVIEVANIFDISEIDRIERDAFNTPWSLDLLRAAVEHDIYEVRVMRNRLQPVTGFYIAHAPEMGTLNLDNFAVDIPHRGQGRGQRLIWHWIDLARRRRLSTLSLQVNTANRRAQILYKRYHFKVVKLLPAYYPNGEDAFQMEVRTSAFFAGNKF